jgi:hypothetical protein
MGGHASTTRARGCLCPDSGRPRTGCQLLRRGSLGHISGSAVRHRSATGVKAGVNTVVARLDLPTQVELARDRFPAEIEASAYFTVAEALTNVVKHAHATRAEVKARVENRTLLLEVCDDGVGGPTRQDTASSGSWTGRRRSAGRSMSTLGEWRHLVAAEAPFPAADDADGGHR